MNTPNITLSGLYTGNDKRGTIIAGKLFLQKNMQTVSIDENLFEKLLNAQENGWFLIKSHNYEEFLAATKKQPISAYVAYLNKTNKITVGKNSAVELERTVEETPVEETPVEKTPVEKTPVEKTPVEETPVEKTPVEETPVETKITTIEQLNELGSVKAQNAAIKSGQVSDDVIDYILANADTFAKSTVNAAESCIM